jgi:hypothetical protein
MARLSVPAIVAIFVAVLALRLGLAPILSIEDPTQRVIEAIPAICAIFAALSFERGDPPLRPWVILAIALLAVPLARLSLHFDLRLGDAKVGHIFLIASNFLCIAAIAGFRRVLVSTGLTAEWSPTAPSGRSLLVLMIAIAAAVLGLIVVQVVDLLPLSALTTGTAIAASVSLVSTICDGILCAGGLLLVWLVRPMLGGSVALPYFLVAFGGAVFLIVDIFHVLLHTTTQDQFASPLPIGVATIGWVALALAGLSQRLLVRT